MCAVPFLSRLTAFLLALNLLMLFLPSLTFPAEENAYPIFDHFPLPKSVSLCGELMPLENRRVWEMLDRELTIAVWDRAQVFMWLKRAGRYFPYIEKKLNEAGMPEDLKYLAVAESSLLTRIRSKKGALGPWQFMAHTARKSGLRRDSMIDERLDFERSTETALKYLKHLKEIFGTWTLALAAYNCGDVRLKKEIKEQKVTDYYRLKLPLETERFIFRIAAIKITMENPERYGYHLKPEWVYRPIECDTVPVRISVPVHLTDVALALGTDFKVLKELNPQILGYYLPTGHYTIKVPSGLGSRMATVLKQLTTVPARSPKVTIYESSKPNGAFSTAQEITEGVIIGKRGSLRDYADWYKVRTTGDTMILRLEPSLKERNSGFIMTVFDADQRSVGGDLGQIGPIITLAVTPQATYYIKLDLAHAPIERPQYQLHVHFN